MSGLSALHRHDRLAIGPTINDVRIGDGVAFATAVHSLARLKAATTLAVPAELANCSGVGLPVVDELAGIFFAAAVIGCTVPNPDSQWRHLPTQTSYIDISPSARAGKTA